MFLRNFYVGKTGCYSHRRPSLHPKLQLHLREAKSEHTREKGNAAIERGRVNTIRYCHLITKRTKLGQKKIKTKVMLPEIKLRGEFCNFA